MKEKEKLSLAIHYYYYFLLLINSQNDVVLGKNILCYFGKKRAGTIFFLNDLLLCLIRNNILRAGTFVIIYFNTKKNGKQN